MPLLLWPSRQQCSLPPDCGSWLCLFWRTPWSGTVCCAPQPLAPSLSLPHQVDKPRQFEMGQWVHIFINDASTGGRRLGRPATCWGPHFGRVHRPLQHIALLPASSARLAAAAAAPSTDKAGSYEEGGEGGSITTFATRRRRLSAAANGTIAAWIYGEALGSAGSTCGGNLVCMAIWSALHILFCSVQTRACCLLLWRLAVCRRGAALRSGVVQPRICLWRHTIACNRRQPGRQRHRHSTEQR